MENAPTPTPAAPPAAQKDGSAVSRAFHRIGLLLGSPTQLFEEIKARPDWLIVFVIVSIVVIGSTILTLPHAAQAARVSLPPDAPPQAAQQVETAIAVQKYINPVVSVVVMLIRTAFWAGLLTGLSVMLTSAGSFKPYFSAMNYINIAAVISMIANSAIVLLRGVDSIQSQMDMFQPLGLNLFAPDAPNWLYALLGSINVFEIWIFALVMIAVRTFTKGSWTTAAIVTFIPWAIGTAIIVGFSAMTPSK